MRILQMPMGSGKTYQLVWLMMQPGNEDIIYVAPTKAQADCAHQIARSLPGPNPTRDRFVSVSQLPIRDKKARHVVDELVGVLSYLIGGEVLEATHTPDELHWRNRRGQ